MSVNAGLFRRLAANIYDSVIIIALWIVATFLILPFNHGVAVKAGTHWYQAYCLLIMTYYFCASWYFYQQTIGMRAWRIRLVALDGKRPGKCAVILRFVYAIPVYLTGIGVWFGWHDRLSKTHLITQKE